MTAALVATMKDAILVLNAGSNTARMGTGLGLSIARAIVE